MICSHFRGLFLFVILLFLSACIRIDIKSEAAYQLSPLYVLAVDYNRAILGDFALIGVRLFGFSSILELDFLYRTIDDLFHKLMSLPVFHLVVVSLAAVREDHIALLGAGSVLNGIAPSNTLPIFDDMVLSGRIFHLNKSASWRYLGGIEKLRFLLIVVFFLESIKEVMSRIFGSFYIFHLFPNLFNVKVHDVLFILHVKTGACIAQSLDMSWRVLLSSDRLLLLLGTTVVELIRLIPIGAPKVDLSHECLSGIGRLLKLLWL